MSDFAFDIVLPFSVGFVYVESLDVGFNHGKWGFEFMGSVGDEDFLLFVGIFDGFDDSTG